MGVFYSSCFQFPNAILNDIHIVPLGKMVRINLFKRSVLVMEIFRKELSGKVEFLDKLILLTEGLFICTAVIEHVLHSWCWGEPCASGEMNQTVSHLTQFSLNSD